jgi:hypothetical protein
MCVKSCQVNTPDEKNELILKKLTSMWMKILNDVACTLNWIWQLDCISLKIFNSTIQLNFSFFNKWKKM